MQRLQGVRRSGLTALTAAALMLGAQGAPRAELLDLSTTPLFLKTGVAPNLIITLDDSGSMERDYMPEGRKGDGRERFYSSTYNGMAYNPNITYEPPLHADGTLFSTDFKKAYTSPFTNTCEDDNTRGCGPIRNLSKNYITEDLWDSGTDDPLPAFYAVFDSGNTNKSNTSCNIANDYDDDNCYSKVKVTDKSGPDDTDETRNFANWYSFYRTRNLATITGASRAFYSLGGDIRVGWQRLNTSKTIKPVEPFTGTHRTAFYSWLFDLPASGNTPLRAALQRAGDYYAGESSQKNQPYYNDAVKSTSGSASCRQNYHVLMTDGMWNRSFSGVDYDDTAQSLPDNTDYTPQPPFQDSTKNTLADLAFKYWATDLSSLADDVPTYMPQQGDSADANYWNPRNDPANWQHLVNFTVGLGLSTALTNPAWGGSTFAGDGYAAIVNGKSWPTASKSSQNNAYDLWHAAINSRGQFFSADDPEALGDAFKTILDRIADRTSSGTSVAVESGSIKHSDNVYIARFNSRDWTGQVVAYKLINDGDIGTAVWDAACALTGGACATDGNRYTAPKSTGRRIITYNPTADNGAGKGVPFRWDSLDESQKTALNGDGLGEARLSYLRGARDKEQKQSNGGDFRNRKGLLGDVVDATPVYVGPPDRFYPDDLETKPYSDFKSNYSDRAGVVYVGANDGMLHAFSASDGEEVFAYMPSAVYDHLSELTDPDYSHRFYVDGTPTEGDAFFGGAWHTVLVGGLRAGGQGIYALDITDPSTSTSEADVATKVLWEFTDANDKDLGYTYSQPQIVLLHNGEWAAVFGNGYNNTDPDDYISTSGHAVLYVVDIADGSLIKKIDTQKGTAETPNGLATVTPADIDGDGIVDYLYAGDLLGNLWKFDVNNGNTNQWGIAHNAPLFTAVRSDVHQPITTAPSIRRHPTGKGFLLLFGTGKYLENSDAKASTDIQSVYGIWDRDDGTEVTRDNLLEQTIEQKTTVEGTDYRVISDNPLTWYTGTDDPKKYLGWYLDLKVKDGPALGEMQVTDSLVRGNRLIFTTLIPNEDPCSLGGDSWLMVLDYRDGGRFNPPVFDTNNDGIYDLADLVAVDTGDKEDEDDDGDDTDADKEKVSVSGQKSKNGILQTPALGSLPDADRAYLGGSDGTGTDCAGQDCTDIGRDPTTRNRQSWRQLR